MTTSSSEEIIRRTLRELPLVFGAETVVDDGVMTISPKLTSGLLLVTVVSGSRNAQGMFAFDSSGAVLSTTASDLEATTGVLSGTTGTDGKLICSADSSKIYIENRLGSQKNIHWLII